MNLKDGYLTRPLEALDELAIRNELSPETKSRIAEIEIHAELDSTNSRLMRLAACDSVPLGTVCLAECQTQGRGRIGRVWHTPPGGNICLSLLWRFNDFNAFSGLSLAIGVAIVRALRTAGVEGVGLKWPNDILWRERKLGGILVEVSGEAHDNHSVVIGIGLNVHIPPDRRHRPSVGRSQSNHRRPSAFPKPTDCPAARRTFSIVAELSYAGLAEPY